MRRVAQALRVAPMTLYTYVPGKAEMVDLMLDVAYLRMARAATEGRPWRQRLTVVAEENRQLLTTHPWVAGVCTLRPPLGPGAIAKYEHELAALDGLGLTDVEMDDCLTYLLMFVQANARAASDTLAIRQETAMNDEQWWTCAGPVLRAMSTAAATPLQPVSGLRPVPNTAAPTIPSMPTASACNASSTGLPYSSTTGSDAT
jgi:AcrR family transcriptional regulator